MSIILARVDDRLIHGQVVQGWLNSIDVDTILVVSNTAAEDEMQKMLMMLAIPSNIHIDIKNLNNAVSSFADYSDSKLFIITASVCDIFRMIELGVAINSINIGGMHFSKGKRQLMYNVFVDNEDIEYLYKIYLRGIEVEGRVLPKDERENIIQLIENEHRCISGDTL
jgi:PTS system mannose-specific IIB component